MLKIKALLCKTPTKHEILALLGAGRVPGLAPAGLPFQRWSGTALLQELKQVRQKSHAKTRIASPISKKQLLLW